MTGRPADPYLPLLREAAGRYQVDPALLAGLVDFESSGRPGAISKAGAVGLGQVMPREAGFAGRPTRQELLDPATNLDWSARILSEGTKRWGSEQQGLAAYLGAINSRGQIVGGDPYTGISGNRYVQTVQERRQRYADPATPPAAAPAGPVAPDWYRQWQAQASPTEPAARPAPAAPDWYRQYLSAGGTRPAAGPAAPAARPTPPTGPTDPGAAPGKQPGWLDLAAAQLGKPYVWGSKGGRSDFSDAAAGFDCSGFVSYVFRKSLGVDVPAYTGTAYQASRGVEAAAAQPGDLVFWNMGTPDPRRQHVAIYVGNGKVIQSGGQGAGVNIAPVTQMPGAEFRRVPAAAGALARTPDPHATTAGTPERPGAVWLQGTVARAPTAASAATAPDWYRQWQAQQQTQRGAP